MKNYEAEEEESDEEDVHIADVLSSTFSDDAVFNKVMVKFDPSPAW